MSGFLAAMVSTSAFANINASIQDFSKLMASAKKSIGIGYSIVKMETYYTNDEGHGFIITLTNHLNIGIQECFHAYHDRTSASSALKFEKQSCDLAQ
jgi:hypothetical protein